MEAEPETFIKAAELSALKASKDKRLHLNINGRYVSLILMSDDEVIAIDSVCYHMGGPLALGDIENLEGNSYIVCPWHFHKINLRNGAKGYQALDTSMLHRTYTEGNTRPSNQLPYTWKESEHFQRVHQVEIRSGIIFVNLQNEKDFKSDEYAFSSICGEKCMTGNISKEIKQGGDGKLNYPKRSGQVLNSAPNEQR